LSGRYGAFLDRNWRINFTKPKRYRSNGITYHMLDYADNTSRSELTVVDVGCSYGVASKTMKDDLAKRGVTATVYGVDVAERVRKRATRNLDHFVGGDITTIPPGTLPKADAVVCSFAVNLVSPEIKYQVIRSCSDLIKEEGVLVTNTFPYERIRLPTTMQFFGAYFRALPSLRGGWSSFTSVHTNLKENLLKRRSRAIYGREAAFQYAESIRLSWNNLSPLEKRFLLVSVFLQDPGPYTMSLFLAALAKLRRAVSDLVG